MPDIEKTDELKPGWQLNHSYAEQLPGFSSASSPEKVPKPGLAILNESLASHIGLDFSQQSEASIAQIFAGNQLPPGARPIAQAYAGHQFGQFNPQLGDGRALLLGEQALPGGGVVDIAYKGSGRTPYSRNGDGKAALGPMLREYLLGEAMSALGVPTTRALAVATTGEPVVRNDLLPGAVLTRVSASHIRVGTFQYFAAQGKVAQVKSLADYTIARHYPDLKNSEAPYLGLLSRVCERQAKLVAQWMSLGFIHGVLNTDNVSIAGETIDYGPCAFMEGFDPQAVFSSIDHYGRYAYQNQAPIMQWNMARFAETLLPLMASDIETAQEQAVKVVSEFGSLYEDCWLQAFAKKLGLAESLASNRDGVQQLLVDFLALLALKQQDFTSSWRALSLSAETASCPAFLQGEGETWFERWSLASEAELKARAPVMLQANPCVIPRNHLVEAALQSASDQGDYEPFHRLLSAVWRPYDREFDGSGFAAPADTQYTASYQTFCGT